CPGVRAAHARGHAGTTRKLAGQSYELEGRFALAIQSYAEGVKVNPRDVVAQVRLGQLRKALAAMGTSSEPGP
ncbi:MAG: hypothetical protein ACLQVF_45060, partial [Isosphaeraceae bacterium]